MSSTDVASPIQPAHPGTSAVGSGATVRKLLLGSGILGSLIYLAAIVLVPRKWPGYSPTSQAISELAAVNAPSRPLFTTVSVVAGLLAIAFGFGVYLSARQDERAMRVTGALIAASAAVGLPLQPFFPMHMRGDVRTVSDTMHLVVVGVSTPITLVAMGFAAATLGRRFRIYSVASLLVVLVFGALSGMAAPKVEAGDPTPWMGTNERISFLGYYVWAVVYAVVLLRRAPRSEVEAQSPGA